MTRFQDLQQSVRDRYPREIQENYEIHEWRNATVIFNELHPEEWQDLMTVLREFRLYSSFVIKPGGNKSLVAKRLDGHLLQFGWKKENFDTQVTVSTKFAETSMTYDVPTHEVDCYKNRIALEVEWNNKDPFFDRDLNNFRLLFELKVLDLDIIVTKTDDLGDIFAQLGRKKPGAATTHTGKLISKIEGGGAGGCPLIVFGITKALHTPDAAPISAEELERIDLVDEAQELLDEDGEEE